jgi:hypothetical protein
MTKKADEPMNELQRRWPTSDPFADDEADEKIIDYLRRALPGEASTDGPIGYMLFVYGIRLMSRATTPERVLRMVRRFANSHLTRRARADGEATRLGRPTDPAWLRWARQQKFLSYPED